MRARRASLVAVILAGLLLILTLHFGVLKPSAQSELPQARAELNQDDRVLILAPHPDDEVLGCGGIIQQALAMGVPVHVAYLTYGDFYEWSFLIYNKRPVLTSEGVEGMGEVRHNEAAAAAAALGVPKGDLSFLGYPDFGTLDMWYRAWGDSEPVKGTLTRATAVPYHDAVRPGAPYKGEDVVEDLTRLIRGFRPTKVFVSHPADHHPDHRALYLFTRICLFDLEEEISTEVYPYLVHYSDWPVPKGLHPARPLGPPGFLHEQILWKIAPLSSHQTRVKLTALREHRTQYKASARYLSSFVRSNELFGDFSDVRLGSDNPSDSVLENAPDDTEMGAEAIGEEDAVLAGIVRQSVRVERDSLCLSMVLTRALAREVGFSVYLFGYRSDESFARMPKLHVKFGVIGHAVYDQNTRLGGDRVRVSRSGRHIDIRVPLDLMDNPQRILSSAQTYAGVIPLDWSAWRVLALTDDTGSKE